MDEKYKQFIIPGAIILAGVIIAGALFFSGDKETSESISVIGREGSGRFGECLASGKYTAAVAKSYEEGIDLGVRGTPTLYVNGRQVINPLAVGSVENMIEEELDSARAPQGVERVAIDTEGYPVLGNSAAPVTLVEFSDFECPFCAQFKTMTLDAIKAKYIDTGKAKFIFRDFPLATIHDFAQLAAEATHCAEEQGKYWEYHDYVFEHQNELSEEGIFSFAKAIGLE